MTKEKPMTKKHFDQLARAIATIDNETDATIVMQTIIGIGLDLNPRFKEETFRARVEELRANVTALTKRSTIPLHKFLYDHLQENSMTPRHCSGIRFREELEDGISAYGGAA